MKYNIQITILRGVDVPIPVVIVDGPNIYHDNICIKHRYRNCSRCKDEMIKLGGKFVKKKRKNTYADTSNSEWFERTLDMSRLPIVVNFIRNCGYRPVIYCNQSTKNWLETIGAVKYPDDVLPKLKILNELHQKGEVVFDNNRWKPKGVEKDSDDNWDDDIWIIHMALQFRNQLGIDSYIMSNDRFLGWKSMRADLDWKLIDEIQIMFEWQPKEVEEKDEQLFLAAKLKKLKNISVENKRANIKNKIDRLQEELSELDATDPIQNELHKFAVTAENILLQEKDLPHVKEIIRAWEKAFKSKNKTTIWDFWWYLNSELGILYEPFNGGIAAPGVDFTNPYSLDEKLVRVKLGFKDDVNPYRVVEECVIIYSDSTGKELKFNPDLTIINRID